MLVKATTVLVSIVSVALMLFGTVQMHRVSNETYGPMPTNSETEEQKLPDDILKFRKEKLMTPVTVDKIETWLGEPTTEEPTTKTEVPKVVPTFVNEERVCVLIDDICNETGFERPGLIKAMVYCESGFNKNCISQADARGLMQITPKWFGELMTQYGVKDLCVDEAGNLRIGIHWMDYLITKYNGDLHKALVAYNRGESVVDQVGVRQSKYSQKVLRIANGYN